MGKRNIIHAIALPDPSSSSESHPLSARWAIQVQPKKIHHWFRVESPPSILFSSRGIINDAPPSSFLVKVLIGENDVQGVDHKVQDALYNLSSSSSGGDAETSWLRNAVGALQSASLIDNFDVTEFMQVAERNLVTALHKDSGGGGELSAEAGGPLEIDYEGRPLRQASPGLEEKVAAMKQKEKKKGGGLGFWVSHGPNATYGHPRTVSQRNSWERQDDAYGGLM